MRSEDVKLIPLQAFPHRSILQNYYLVHLRQEANAMCHQNPLSITALQYSFIKVGHQNPLSITALQYSFIKVGHQNPLSIKVLQYSFIKVGRQFSPLSNIVIALSSGIS